jgi:hypothetical protein
MIDLGPDVYRLGKEERPLLFGVFLGYADEQHPVNGFRTRRAELDGVAYFASCAARRRDSEP